MASPLVEQFRKGGVTRDVRLTAAASLLPLKPSDKVELLFLLTRDSDEEVRQKAESSLMDVPEQELDGVFRDRATSAEALGFYGKRLDSPELTQIIIQNPSTDDKTITEMVSKLSADVLEIVVINQMRLLRHPPLLEAVEASSSLNSDQRRRLTELKHDFKLGAQPEKAAPAAEPEPEKLLNLNEGPPEDEAPPASNFEEAMEIYGEEQEKDLTEEEQQKKKSALSELMGMNAAEKMMAALKANREKRMILIRDRNRVVYSAVLSSPKLTNSDVEFISQMKNVSPEVLRTIGGKREWTKQYSIRHELVKNALTPIEISLRQISSLSSMDLKKLTRDRNVPEQVRRQALKLTRGSK